MEAHRTDRRRRFVLAVNIVSGFIDERARPDRAGALRMARELYPDGSDQRLEEILWTHTSYPYGDLEKWTLQLIEQKVHARTIFPST